jgi:hypothetical protein
MSAMGGKRTLVSTARKTLANAPHKKAGSKRRYEYAKVQKRQSMEVASQDRLRQHRYSQAAAC